MKSKIFLIILVVFSATTLFTSCEKIKGKGEVVTVTRTTANYNSIDLAMSATVYFTQGTDYTLQLSGQENVLTQVVTEVDGNQLVIRVKDGVILGSHEPIKVYVTAPSVSRLAVSGSGDVFVDNVLTAEELSINISGSGSINLGAVDLGHLVSHISGSGSIRAVSGTAIREDLNISGSGTIDIRNIEAGTVYSTTSGSGETYLHATTLLDVTISGSGNVWYYGTPGINMHISGSGSVKRM